MQSDLTCYGEGATMAWSTPIMKKNIKKQVEAHPRNTENQVTSQPRSEKLGSYTMEPILRSILVQCEDHNKKKPRVKSKDEHEYHIKRQEEAEGIK